IALETMAGKGTEIGRSFEELAAIFDGVTHNEKLSVCLDTCHIHDAGYDVVNDFDGVLDRFDKMIGIDRLKVIHVNDSKNEQGASKDRHENIGLCYINLDTIHQVVHHPQQKDLTKIIETPYVGENKKNKKPPYKFEMEMIKKGDFQSDLKGKIVNQ